MPSPGDILYYKDFEFKDRSKGDKLFVVLNAADIITPCLVLKTTSRPNRYPGVSRGYNSSKKVFFVPCSWGNCFNLDTYIQLPEIFEVSTAELLQGSFSKQIETLPSSLPRDCYSQLKNCLKQFKEDISQRHWKLIYKS